MIYSYRLGQIMSGQVRSESLTCTFRASCCSARRVLCPGSFRLAARILLYAPSHIHDSIYHGLCHTSRASVAGKRNSSMDTHLAREETLCHHYMGYSFRLAAMGLLHHPTNMIAHTTAFDTSVVQH